MGKNQFPKAVDCGIPLLSHVEDKEIVEERKSSEVRNTEGGIKTEGSIAENHRGALC